MSHASRRETRGVTSEADWRRVAQALLGDSVAAVTYVGLTYADPFSVEWSDLGQLVAAASQAAHSPELKNEDIYLGHDEVLVLFSDERASALGL
jgi:hypothetical protein